MELVGGILFLWVLNYYFATLTSFSQLVLVVVVVVVVGFSP